MSTVLSIHNDVRSLLNDIFGDIFTDAILLPFTKKAYQELQNELILNGLADVKEESAEINLAANVTSIVAGGFLPTDLIVPISLFYKDTNTGEFIEFTERYWAPGTPQENVQTLWRWEEGEIKLVGATVATIVRIKYLKFLTALVNTSSEIKIINSDTYLAARIAAIAAATVGNNVERAMMHNSDAKDHKTVLINTLVKRRQDESTRRQPYRK
jgi:hypothetical protein